MKSLFFPIKFLQKLENPKGQCIRKGFFDNPWSESPEGLSCFHECLNLLEDGKLGHCMFSDGKTLDLRTNYFERMGKRGADHPRNHTGHKVVDACCFRLLVKSVI